MSKVYFSCLTCRKQSTTNNFEKHTLTCSRKKTKKKKIRGIDFDPNIGYKNGTRSAWNKGKTKDTDETVARIAVKLKARFDNGDLKPRGYFSKEFFESEKGRKSRQKGGGYREGAGRSKKFRVYDSFGTQVCLQSSYELRCSEILDDLGILWMRPSHLKYDLDRKYFPDFYLPEFGVYLDPKNNFLAVKDKEKIEKVEKANNVQVLVIKEEMLNVKSLSDLLSIKSVKV